ncbi:Heme oxygenase [Phycisphaerae bacterium RAS1]|nr:Heme oxygenase [Phycisphaerae bacterium RAS1]
MITETVSHDVMSRLRAETAVHHQRAELGELEQALAAGSLPLAAFVRLLEQRYCVHRNLERRMQALAARHSVVGQIAPERLFQEENLRADLLHFGVDPASVSPLPATAGLCATIERLAAENPLALLGCYYVFEGSKNGSRFIAKRLRPAYGLDQDGMRYLDPHGEEQRALWLEFKQRMNAAGFGPSDQNAMVAAAQATFEGVAALDAEIYALVAPRRG